MPRRIFQTSRFNGGMILNADPADLPDGFGVASFNTMSSLDSGSIGGRYSDGESNGYNGVIQHAYITDGSSYYLTYLDTDGSLWVDGELQHPFTYALGGKCITGHRNFAIIGRGRSERPLYYGYPNGRSEAVICEHDFDPNFLGHSVEFWNGTPYLEEDAIVYYAASIVYDGYMHGPLLKFYSLPITQPGQIVEGVSYPAHVSTVRITLSLLMPNEMIPRVSKVILYRSVNMPGMSDQNQASEYVRVCDFTDLSNMVYIEGNSIQLPDGTIIAGNPVVIGNSYTNESGLDETLSFCTLSYETAYEMNNFLFVGNIGHVHSAGYYPNGREILKQDIEDGTRLLYRSLRGKHGQFSIISDFLALSFTPLAMTSFNSRLLVFGSAEFAVVNPETMTIEDVVHGYGLESPLCLHQTLEGIFFANRNNMYVYDGQRVIPIGNPVMRAWDVSVVSALDVIGIMPYESIAQAGGIQKIVYSARINSVLFLYTNTEHTSAYVFSLDTHTWSVFSFASADSRSAYIDRSNVLYIGNTAAMGGTDKITSWKYLTGRFTFGDQSQEKKIYTVNLKATNHNAICQASFDGGEFVGLYQAEVPEEYRRAHTIMIKFDPNEIYATYLSSIEITYREMNIH